MRYYCKQTYMRMKIEEYNFDSRTSSKLQPTFYKCPGIPDHVKGASNTERRCRSEMSELNFERREFLKSGCVFVQ
jgi:hypothetical protein